MSAELVASTKPAAKPTRMALVHRVAELMGRYRPALKGKHWRLVDLESAGDILPAEYGDEDTARAGARLQAGYDIYDLFNSTEGRS